MYGYLISFLNLFLGRFLKPDLVQAKLSLKLHFDDIWAGTYNTFAKVVGKNDIYVFGLNNYHQMGTNSTVLFTLQFITYYIFRLASNNNSLFSNNVQGIFRT